MTINTQSLKKCLDCDNSSLQKVVLMICKYSNMSPSEIGDLFNEKLPYIVLNGIHYQGIRNIIRALNMVSSETSVEASAIDGYAEYCVRNFSNWKRRFPSELHNALEQMDEMVKNRVYLIGYELTAADIIVYCFLRDILENLKIQEKDKLTNICRWFDFIQRDSRIQNKEGNQLLTFWKTRIFV